MRAVIMAGGFGTRIGLKPKGLMKVGEKKVLDCLICKLGFIDVILYTNTLYAKQYVDWAKDWGVEVFVAPEVSPNNQNGVWANYLSLLDVYGIDDTLFVAVDNLSDLNFNEFLNWKGWDVSKVAVYDVGDPKVPVGRYGVVELDNYVVKEFIEKPKIPVSSLVMTGFAYLTKSYHKYLPVFVENFGETNFGDYFSFLVDLSVDLYAYVHKGLWFDVGGWDKLREAEKYGEVLC